MLGYGNSHGIGDRPNRFLNSDEGDGDWDPELVDGLPPVDLGCWLPPTPPTKPACDLAQACGDAQCQAKQSTFYSYDADAVLFASDNHTATCMKTADATKHPNPRRVHVDLAEERLIGTVCFVSEGAPTDFSVAVSAADAGPGLASDRETPALNPTYGGKLPDGTVTEACTVKAVGDGVFEGNCPGAAKGSSSSSAAPRPRPLRCGGACALEGENQEYSPRGPEAVTLDPRF